MKRGLRTFLIILLIAILGAAYYLTFIYHPSCTDVGCFQNAMKKCSHATYVNEEPEASWKYDIKGSKGGACAIDVTLLQAKEGELSLDKLTGYSMLCSYPVGIFS